MDRALVVDATLHPISRPSARGQKPLGRYIADFYCSACRLVIEVDGDSHFVDEGERDLRRTAALQALGIRVVRFTNEDVMQRFEGVCMEIRKALNPPLDGR